MSGSDWGCEGKRHPRNCPLLIVAGAEAGRLWGRPRTGSSHDYFTARRRRLVAFPHVASCGHGDENKRETKEGMERGREGGGAVDARRGHRPCPPAGPQIHGPIAEVTLNQSAFPSLMLSINSPFVLEASLLYKPKTVKKW